MGRSLRLPESQGPFGGIVPLARSTIVAVAWMGAGARTTAAVWLAVAASAGCAALRIPSHCRCAGASFARASESRACAGLSCAPVQSPSSVSTGYDAQQITVLEGLEPVRKRPGMYIGSTGARGLHHLVFEVVDNSVDEALAGWATEVNVTIHASGLLSVSDNGRGIPCDVHTKTGKPALETVLTVLHAGGKFGGGGSGYMVSGGLHGVGVSVVNALSDSLTAEVRRAGMLHRMRFSQGLVMEPMVTTPLSAAEAGATGTRIAFSPDPTIFKGGVEFEYEVLARKLDQQAYLNAGLVIRLRDERGEGADTTFLHSGGIAEYVDHICEGKLPLLDEGTLSYQSQKGDVQVCASTRASQRVRKPSAGRRTVTAGAHGWRASG